MTRKDQNPETDEELSDDILKIYHHYGLYTVNQLNELKYWK